MRDISLFSIALDLDGVLADTDAGIRNFGFNPDGVSLLPGSGSAEKRAMYEAVKGTTFYAHLPLMPGATKLYNFCRPATPIILTAAPKFDGTNEEYYLNPHWLGAAYHKRNWVETVLLPKAAMERWPVWKQLSKGLFDHESTQRRRIADERFICTTSARKHEFMHRKHSDHQILIDDRTDNIEAWQAAGGIGILYKNADDAIRQLLAI